MKLFAAAAAMLFLGVSTARADAIYDKCVQAANSNVDFGECGSAYMKRADARLNVAWKQVFGAVTGQTKTDLLDEQRAWIAYKEKSCNLYANGEQGREGQVISFPACRGDVIEARTKALRDIGKSLQSH